LESKSIGIKIPSGPELQLYKNKLLFGRFYVGYLKKERGCIFSGIIYVKNLYTFFSYV